MIRHIVFDMGQVLVNFNIGLFTDRLRLSEADAALIRREVLTTVEWVRMDRGTISDDDALARMQANCRSGVHSTPSSGVPVQPYSSAIRYTHPSWSTAHQPQENGLA